MHFNWCNISWVYVIGPPCLEWNTINLVGSSQAQHMIIKCQWVTLVNLFMWLFKTLVVNMTIHAHLQVLCSLHGWQALHFLFLFLTLFIIWYWCLFVIEVWSFVCFYFLLNLSWNFNALMGTCFYFVVRAIFSLS